MKLKTVMSTCSPLVLLVLASTNVQAFSLEDIENAAGVVQKGSQALRTGQIPALVTAVPTVPGATAAPGTAADLTNLLVKQLGVTQEQAQGGAGAMFQVAKSKMQAPAFNQLGSAVPGMPALLAAAPMANPATSGGWAGLASVAGASIGGNTGSLIGLISSFKQLGMGADMVPKFVPVMTQYVQGTGGTAAATALQNALIGGLGANAVSGNVGSSAVVK